MQLEDPWGMARPFDHGKAAYAKDHRSDTSSQQTRHILGDEMLQHYGAKPENYSSWSQDNYRMGLLMMMIVCVK